MSYLLLTEMKYNTFGHGKSREKTDIFQGADGGVVCEKYTNIIGVSEIE